MGKFIEELISKIIGMGILGLLFSSVDGWDDVLGLIVGIVILLVAVALVLVVVAAVTIGLTLAWLYVMMLYEKVRSWCWVKWGIRLPESWLESTDKPEVSNTLAAIELEAAGSEKETTSTRRMRGLILVSALLIVIVCISI